MIHNYNNIIAFIELHETHCLKSIEKYVINILEFFLILK